MLQYITPLVGALMALKGEEAKVPRERHQFGTTVLPHRLCQRVMLLDEAFEAFFEHVGVDLRR
jgi:hypothetical protein